MGLRHNQQRIQSALDAAGEDWATIHVPEGIFLTGALHLRPFTGLAETDELIAADGITESRTIGRDGIHPFDNAKMVLDILLDQRDRFGHEEYAHCGVSRHAGSSAVKMVLGAGVEPAQPCGH